MAFFEYRIKIERGFCQKKKIVNQWKKNRFIWNFQRAVFERIFRFQKRFIFSASPKSWVLMVFLLLERKRRKNRWWSMYFIFLYFLWRIRKISQSCVHLLFFIKTSKKVEYSPYFHKICWYTCSDFLQRIMLLIWKQHYRYMQKFLFDMAEIFNLPFF